MAGSFGIKKGCYMRRILSGALSIVLISLVCLWAGSDILIGNFDGQPTYKVTDIVDGDTVKISMEGKETIIRLIGVDTPETVDPRKPVQYYGKEASTFTTNLLKGEDVYVETEPGMTVDIDKRRLLYLFRSLDGLFVNLEIIRQGYGRVYDNEFKYKKTFIEYEERAKELEKGLWMPSKDSDRNIEKYCPDINDDSIVNIFDLTLVAGNYGKEHTRLYITGGNSYHSESCPVLSRSKHRIPITLEVAKLNGYEPCGRCNPPK